MSILDDAIREHLELKRAHGADEAELKRLEDEAFGPPGRPDASDSLAEAPTEFMSTPEAAEAATPEEGSARRINVADLQEPPPPKPREEEPQIEAVPTIEEPQAKAAPVAPAEDPVQAAPPAEEPVDEETNGDVALLDADTDDAPAANADESTSGDERQAIAEQPTELFDIEAEMGTEDAPVVESALDPPTEIHASRAEAPAEPLDEEDEEDDEFWNEQRLSDELDQALEAPLTDEHEIPAPTAEPTSTPAVEPAPSLDDDGEEDEGQPRPDFDPDTGHEDVLEDTPEFLEDAPEDDELWFEQKPPKDFDLD
jgi:hypothetical protein